jgi:hypothetical protein
MLRFLLVKLPKLGHEAFRNGAASIFTWPCDEEERSPRWQWRGLAMALYWMWRKGWDYERVKKFGSQGRKLFFHTVLTKGSTR